MAKMPEPDDFLGGRIIAEIYCHIIFWTRGLAPVVTPQSAVHIPRELGQAMFTVDGEALAAGGTANHIHILARCSPEHSLQEAIDALRKGSTAAIARATGAKKFSWHESEVAVSIDHDNLDAAKEYIVNQAEHHELVTFEQELKAICDEHGFEYDEHELWG